MRRLHPRNADLTEYAVIGEHVYLQPVPSLEVVAKGTIVKVLDEGLVWIYHIRYGDKAGWTLIGPAPLPGKHIIEPWLDDPFPDDDTSARDAVRERLSTRGGTGLSPIGTVHSNTGPLRHADRPRHSDKPVSA